MMQVKNIIKIERVHFLISEKKKLSLTNYTEHTNKSYVKPKIQKETYSEIHWPDYSVFSLSFTFTF